MGNSIHSGTQAIFRKYAIPYDKGKTRSKYQYRTLNVLIILSNGPIQSSGFKEMAPKQYASKIFQFEEKSVPDPWYSKREILMKPISLYWKVVKSGWSR